ncbi:MAG: hypothetical protein K2H07_08460, partial [Lachnospiraceae bacterium]|nr:hypothetical protein [Lachnospiraceae bacterium]
GESTTINQLIKNLVNGNTVNSGLKINKDSALTYPIEKSPTQFQSRNYIGYTATPYANVLNESGMDSLYPKDFLAVLKGSKEYFGPQQIFGNAEMGYDGLDILRTISKEDYTEKMNSFVIKNTELVKQLDNQYKITTIFDMTQPYYAEKKSVKPRKKKEAKTEG